MRAVRGRGLGFWRAICGVIAIRAALVPLCVALAGFSVYQTPDGVKYQEYVPAAGVGPPVVLLSGSAGPLPVEGMAKGLSDQGYYVLLCAGKDFSTSARGRDTLRKMVSIAQTSPHVRPQKVAVIGLSLGGTSALQLASTEPDLVALSVAYFPGTSPRWISDKEDLIRRWTVPTIAFAGEDDRGPGGNYCCMADTIRAMAATAKQLGVPFELIVYPGAGHDFTWPGSSVDNRNAAEDSWRRTLDALHRYLR
jgi:pimeloyl-ACP methyl ester carboxylesterase